MWGDRMKLADRAIRARDQLILNRVSAAVVQVAMEKGRQGKAALADAGKTKSEALTPILLATLDDSWLEDDDALIAGVRGLWGKV